MSRLKRLDSALALGPSLLTSMLRLVDPTRYKDRLAPSRFTFREVIAHLADFQPVIRHRMELALSSPGSEVPDWDQEEEAVKNNYGAWDIPASLQKYADERAQIVTLFTSLSDDETLLAVQHPTLGVLTIFDLAVFVTAHDTYHFEQVSQYLPKG